MNSENIEIFKPQSAKSKPLQTLILTAILLTGLGCWSADPYNINIKAMLDNSPASIWIFAPSMVPLGQEIEISVQIWDYCERLVCGYNKEISFYSTDPDAQLPSNYRFKPSGLNQGMFLAQDLPFGDGGIKSFSVRFFTPGIHYINVSEVEGTLKGTSNPILVYDPIDAPELFLYWGDIHSHTTRCDGSGYLSEAFYYAKEIARCDFAAVTTHDHFIEPMLGPLNWEMYWKNHKEIVNMWNKPGEFVTLQAYEYRGEYFKPNSVGDMCIYSDSAEIPYYPGHIEEYTTPNLLFNALKQWKSATGNNILAIPHHPPHNLGGLTFDWSYYNSEFIKLVEMYSVHGSSEVSNKRSPGENRFPLIGVENNRLIIQETERPGHHIQDALAMGFKIGFMASGDSHDGRPGHSISHTDANHLLQAPLSWGALPHLFRIHHHYPNGMVAAFAANLTRSAIFDSLYNRRVYAVKGVSRPLLMFSINDTEVGRNDSYIKLPNINASRSVKITAAVGGGYGNLIERVIIYRNNQIWQNITCLNRTASFAFEDTTPIQQMEYNIHEFGVIKNGKWYINEEADMYVEPATLKTNGTAVYYAKMYDTQGGAAWVGPLWVGT